MRCPACGQFAVTTGSDCEHCGHRLSDLVKEREFAFLDGVRRKRQIDSEGRLGTMSQGQERVLWRGRYSWKGMFRELILVILITLLVGWLRLQSGDPAENGWMLPVIVVVWGAFLAMLLFRKLDASYTLTTQRLMHGRGVLYRRMRRIEAIDIDDLAFEQGILERIINVGRIHIEASDVSDRALMLEGIDRPRDVYELIERARRNERLRYGLHIEAV